MNLAERLYVKPLYLWDRKVYFKVDGKTVQGINGLIDEILERTARIFGRISNEKAKELQTRLAAKYSRNHVVTMKNLYSHYKCGFSYPRREAIDLHYEAIEKEAKEIERKEALRALYEGEFDYCSLKRVVRCYLCQKNVLWYEQKGKCVYVDYAHFGRSIMVCKSRKCRALAHYYQKKRDAHGVLIDAILDTVSSDEKYRQLRKHFI